MKWVMKEAPLEVTVRVKRMNDRAFLPTYAHKGDAGMDFYLPEDISIPPGVCSVKVPLGIAMEIPKGYYLAIVLRSSTGLKSTLRLSNGYGVIDSGYRGEVSLILDNIRQPDAVRRIGYAEYKRGDRIAQGILVPVPMVKLEEAEELSASDRGSGGFGSSGK